MCLKIEFWQFSTCYFFEVLVGAHASFVRLHVRTETLIGAGCDDVLLHLLFVASLPFSRNTYNLRLTIVTSYDLRVVNIFYSFSSQAG